MTEVEITEFLLQEELFSYSSSFDKIKGINKMKNIVTLTYIYIYLFSLKSYKPIGGSNKMVKEYRHGLILFYSLIQLHILNEHIKVDFYY